jgi:hypothetical protein
MPAASRRVGPDDVVALVEARLQLDEHRHLLALLGRLDQQVDERRVGADAVQRHLDGDDVRVLHRGPEERLDRRERIERVVHQVVLVADLLEDARSRRGPDVRGENGGPSARAGAAFVSSIQSPNPIRSLVRVTTSSSTSKFSMRMFSTRAASGVDLQQRQRAVAQLLQAAVHRLEQVVGLVLLDDHVGVADDAEQVRALDLRAGNSSWMFARITSSRNTNAVWPSPRRQVLGQRHEPRQHVGHLHARELRPPPWRTTTARFMLRFEMYGNGCPGSNASGVSTG